MLCAISGEAPTTPVASSKSGTVFEKRLIEAYISEHGKDPVTGEELAIADLIELKSSRVVRPRPPALTSIPSLLATFQNEWDALALETHTLRQQLSQTRQELSTALYQHDAAIRVIARLLRERDEARDALSKISIGSAPAVGGSDAMEVDTQSVPSYIQDKVEETMKEKSASRRKRAIPADWATPETVSSFATVLTSEQLYPGCASISLDTSGELALLGGHDGTAGIYSIPQKSLLSPLKSDDGAIIDVLWAGSKPLTGTASGVIRVWDESGSTSTAISTHAGEVTALALHPRGDILGSVGADKSWAMHDLETGKSVVQVYGEAKLTSAHFHPDGHLFATGTASSVAIYDVRTTALGATFGPLSGAVASLHFSENGYWLALAVSGESAVEIWDLRKMAQVKALDIGARVDSVRWDWSGQYVAAVGPSGVSVQHYAKGSKSWSEVVRVGTPGVATAWGARGASLVTVSKEGVLTVLGAEE